MGSTNLKEIKEEYESEKDWEDNVIESDDAIDESSLLSKFVITSYPIDKTLREYRADWGNGKLIIPEFQREYVWDKKRASKLIETFLLGLPVPQVFLYEHSRDKPKLILDGVQRITSVVSFLNGEFPLKGIHSRWDGRSFEELSEDDQYMLESAFMRAVIIMQHNPSDHSCVYEIFARLNTGGIPLNDMQIRMCVAEGAFTRQLKEMNLEPLWRSLLGIQKPNKHLKDVELLLRAFAFFNIGEAYHTNMKTFLDNFIERCKRLSSTEIVQDKENLFRILDLIAKIKEKPFHITDNKLNAALMDALIWGVKHSHTDNVEILKENYEKLLKHERFMELFQGKNPSHKVNVLARLELAKNIFS